MRFLARLVISMSGLRRKETIPAACGMRCGHSVRRWINYPSKTWDNRISFSRWGVVPLRIDIITSLEGLTFADCWPRRSVVPYEGLHIPVISLDDLIANKRALGRTRDLADVEMLERVRKTKTT